MSAIAFVGPVDHGKSTLIGRLLLDSGALARPEQARIRGLEREVGLAGALVSLLDSLEVEREGLFTLDTTRRVLGKKGSQLTIIDTPGHQELITNMLTGASSADAAVLVLDLGALLRETTFTPSVDAALSMPSPSNALLANNAATQAFIADFSSHDARARQFALRVTHETDAGIESELLRYGEVLAFLGLTHPGVVLTKTDVFGPGADLLTLVANVRSILEALGLEPPWIMPVSALSGANVSTLSDWAWFAPGQEKRPLLAALPQLLPPEVALSSTSFRLLVQGIDSDGAVSGKVVSGELQAHDTVTVWPGAYLAVVQSVLGFPRARRSCQKGDFASLSLTWPQQRGVVSRGSVICGGQSAAQVFTKVLCSAIWFGECAPEVGMRGQITCGYVCCAAEIVQVSIATREPLTLCSLGFALDSEVVWEAGIPPLSRIIFSHNDGRQEILAMGMIGGSVAG